MNTQREPAWRIDALDARGGLAFACYRGPDLGALSVTSGDLPAVFLGAPAFQPMNVPHRAVGLAAARYTFQTGLFVGQEEVPFGNLEDVVEFVRRCYVRGGGGDGGQTGEGGPPLLPDGGPNIPPISEPPEPYDAGPEDYTKGRSGSIRDALQSELKEFATLVHAAEPEAPLGAGRLTPWAKSLREGNTRTGGSRGANSSNARDGANMLVWAALTLLHEMLRRLPVNGSDDELLNWMRKANRLGVAINRLGLWPLLNGRGHRAKLDPVLDVVLRDQSSSRNSMSLLLRELSDGLPEHLRADCLLAIFFACTWSDRAWYALEMLTHTLGFSPLAYGSVDVTECDPMDDMEAWPVPQELSFVAAGPEGISTSLEDFLSGFLGSPPIPSPAQERLISSALCLLLFAAACIVSVPSTPRAYIPTRSVSPPLPAPVWASLHLQSAARIANEAHAWLVQQFPRRAFAFPLETMIQTTSRLVYANPVGRVTES